MEKIGSIAEADKYILSLDPKNSLILFDVDDTLIRSQHHGGRWHAKILGEYVRKNPHDIGIIYDAREIMNPGIAVLPEFEMYSQMKKYLKHGFRVMIVTARTKDTVELTYHQLKPLYDIYSLYAKDIYRESPTHLLRHGMVFTSGHDKGKSIRGLLKVLTQEKKFNPSNVVFIDNSIHECQNVAREFQGTPVKIFHYLGAQKLESQTIH